MKFRNQILSNFFIFVLVINQFQTLKLRNRNRIKFKSNFKLMKKQEDKSEKDENIESQKEENKEIIQTGWIRYIKYIENHQPPSSFFKNPSYEKQLKYEAFQKDKNSDKIPSETHFYAVLENRFLNIFEDKNHLKNSVYDALPIETISPIPEDNTNKGPIRGVDKFSEGYCLKVPTSTNGEITNRKIWLICTNDEQSARSFVSNLIQTKINLQHQNGETITVSGENDLDPDIGPKKGSLDGYWRIAKDWGECSKICGGGTQYRQLVCVKPTIGSKNCQGSSIRERPCNTHPCPDPEEFAGNQNMTIDFEHAEIKYVPISDKPQRYDKCVIKETDALVVDDIEKQDKAILLTKEREPKKIPVRLVMNTKSITAFRDDKYETPFRTLDLKTTEFIYKREKETNSLSKFCFIIQDGSKTRIEACQIDCNEGESKTFVEEWNYEIDLFKNRCHTIVRNTVDADIQFESEVKKLKSELENKQKEEVKEEELNKEIRKLEEQRTTQEVNVYSFLQKEKKLEDLLEKEEEERNAEELHDLQLQMEEEKKKTSCLIQSLKTKKLAKKLDFKQAEVAKDIQEIKQMAQRQLNEMREASKKRIAAKKKIQARQLKDMNEQIQHIRSEAAEKIKAINLVGNENNCFIGTQESKSDIEVYCGVAFLNNPAKYIECKNLDSFCFTCCENEFPEDDSKREDCYNKMCTPKDLQ